MDARFVITQGQAAIARGALPVLGVRIRRESGNLRAASWRPVPQAVRGDVLLPCAWPELERLAQIATGSSRARVNICDFGAAGPDRRLVLCWRQAPGAVRVEGSLAPDVEVLAAQARAAVLRVAAVHREAGRLEEAQLWRGRARQILKNGRAARCGRSVRAALAGLPTLGRRT
ncbi:hypothetical protein [Streptomyces triticiradicis]|uniref:Uncharacterized protein n=1 Tax=Streptomyces triticiradicis TaxID=2651189 RepID=A0A7J5D4F4_9ACTN|nr:hypothetical protein [Streptomyces triticiradicis]KAB1978513.1 hypothetical protein F8144_39410 [Streptomyces triticiradicis]